MIKAVIFDFFGVICSDSYWQFVKSDVDQNSSFKDLAEDVNTGEIDWREFVAQVASATGKPVDEVKQMYKMERVDPRMVALVDRLHKKYKTALLTNAHHDFIDGFLSKNHLESLFDEVIVSSRLGVTKPNPTIFDYALEKIGVKAEEAVYIDDLEVHASSAKSVGMNSIVFEGYTELITELKKHIQI